jgi:predicted metal-dependent HD superfamily phosphohydrolase
MNSERWQAMLRGLGVPPETDTFARLQSAYAEKHRAYHTPRHIDESLSLLDEFKHLAANPAEVECALWFHDAVYEPMSKSNEERSANWAAEFAGHVGVLSESVARICAHIMATRHVALPVDDDSRLVVDIDLAILGADPSRYDEFEYDVRREYRWVPGFVYRSKRAAILQSFLDRPRIYHSEPAYERFEGKARTNLSGAIRSLVGGS